MDTSSAALDFNRQLTQWRHRLHRAPETGFEEHETSAFAAEVLEGFGLEVTRGIGGTGFVASLSCGDGRGVVGLRAEMDALNIHEQAPERGHASIRAGKSHACGHDGHMSMVLGAAKLLCERRDFNGTVRFIFQPAEEHGKGAKAMIADRLFERFPVDEIYGVHNIPGLRAGYIATRAGGIMASEDNFVIRINGRGGHAARPHMTIDPIVIAAEIVLALQTVVSRSVDPGVSAVISCTELFTDGIRNAIPGQVIIKGDTRSYTPAVQQLLETRMRSISEGICAAHGAECTFEYTHEFVPTVNTPECVPTAIAAATAVVGAANVDGNVAPMMISEDFGAFLQVVPGNFAFIGNGAEGEPGATPLHNARYDFNDAVLPIGARFLAEIVRTKLPIIHHQRKV
ncbi:M20 family metallopeptidase [Caballeronia sp. SEWSISQ10-4 2]|uniref:M20 aminoacylase family protein n=1 Tax=Caballeronia sp. SEWSISQ10-4 2 TaxID=2937438 RepID=UPI002653F91F|nr:M20 aminoacylase family protein [Caballeronia sp. SEWSISQ10-4 2]MDN7178533.1 M20 family metallopeptidase [Caballeronia sp. SEWSISQ10-4 2]